MYFRLHKLVNSKLLMIWFPYLSRIKIYLGVTFGSRLVSRDMTSLVALVTKALFQEKLKRFTPFERALKIDEKKYYTML